MRNKTLIWFLIIFISILIGLYFGLGTIFGLFYLYSIFGIATVLLIILGAVWNKVNKKLIFTVRVFMTLLIGLVFSFITIKTKNHLNKENAESLISDLNSYQLKNGFLPKALSELVPGQADRVPKYFDTYELKEFQYQPTELGGFSLKYYLDGWHINKYQSETNNWKISD
jgi:hypothetical protein